MKKSVNVLLTRKMRAMKKRLPSHKSKIDLENINADKIIEILNKHQEKSLHEISVLKHYVLNKTKIITKFSNDNLDQSDYDLLLSLSLPSSSYKSIKNENSTVINIGDPAEYLFIILKGKAAIYQMQKIHKEMPGYEYYLLLQNYKNNKENYLLEKTVSDNNLTFPIETSDIYILDKIILKIFLNKLEKRILPNYLDLIIEKAGMKYSDFKLESYIERIERRNKSIIEGLELENKTLEEKIEEYKKNMIYNLQDAWNVAFRNEKKILDELRSIDIEILKKYIFLTKTKNDESITFYKCIYTKTLEESDYFGDSERRIYINKVMSLSDSLELLCIKTDLYNEFVRRIKSKLLGSQINFLLDNFFFRSIYKNYFEKYYFKYFELIQFKMKQIIVKENDPIEYCYFIKSGTVKLTSTRSILENHILIELIKNVILKTGPYSNDADIHKSLSELYCEIKNNIEYLNDEMKNRNNSHIMTLNEKNCLGCSSYYYGLNYLYSAEANSDVVEVYKISSDKLMKMLRDKIHRAFYYYKKYCEQSIRMFFERLIKLNDMSLVIMKKNKVRHFGDIYNFENVENLEEKLNKNDKKLNNIVDKFKLIYSNSLKDINNANNTSYEKEKENENDKNNIINDNQNRKVKSNLFLTQNAQTPLFQKISSNNLYINLRKKSDSIKTPNVNDHPYNNQNNRILRNMIKNKSFNLLNSTNNEKDSKKDLTSYIKVFDYKENLLKQENREELRAKMGLLLLKKAERNEILKLKKENKTCDNFFKLSIGNNRTYLSPFHIIKEDNNINVNNNIDISKKNEENEVKSSYLVELYQKDNLMKNRMIMTSLYKNKFSDYFDKKLGIRNFKYDMSKTLLVNKKKFEYSIFDSRYNTYERNKARSLQNKRRRKKYTNLAEVNKLDSMKNFHLKIK